MVASDFREFDGTGLHRLEQAHGAGPFPGFGSQEQALPAIFQETHFDQAAAFQAGGLTPRLRKSRLPHFGDRHHVNVFHGFKDSLIAANSQGENVVGPCFLLLDCAPGSRGGTKAGVTMAVGQHFGQYRIVRLLGRGGCNAAEPGILWRLPERLYVHAGP
jgi:hypothetical protein